MLAAELARRGVPEAALLLERSSLVALAKTRPFYRAQLLEARSVSPRVGIVSCDWHLRRALLWFRRAGLEAEPVPAAAPALPFTRRTLRQLREQGAWLLDWAIAG